MADLQGQVAIVTGSSRGIGAAIAELFARHGAKVAVHGRDLDAIGTVVARIASAGGEALPTPCDLTRYDDVEAMRETIEGRLGPVEILVANAGGSAVRPDVLERLSEGDWNPRSRRTLRPRSSRSRPSSPE